MLSLVDYAGSDDDESQNEECICAEVVSNSEKRLTSANKNGKTINGWRQDDAVIEGYDDISNAGKACNL